MGKALKAIGTAIVVGGLVIATGGAAIIPAAAGGGLAGAMGTAVSVGGFSVTAGAAIQAGSLIASIGTAITAKKAASSSGYSTEWMADPDQPIPFAFGRVGAAGLIIHKDEYGGHGAYYSVLSVMSGAGPIRSFGTFKADQKVVTFTGPGGMAKTSEWADYMWRGTRLGTQPDTALLSPSGIDGVLPEWGAAYKTSGKAVYMLTMAQNSKLDKYPDGEPKVMQEVEGLFYWDPRLDSTYPGGFGSCRLDQPSTWVWGENGALFALKWALGLWEDPVGKGAPGVGVCVGGIGASRDGIEIADFVTAANIADANGWKCAAWPNTKESKRTVFEWLLQSAGAVPNRVAGKISCISRGAPQPSIVTVTAKDTAGPIELDAATPRLDRINEITPRFWDPRTWELTATDPVKVAAYVTADGGRRPRGVDYPYVPTARQAGQLAAYDIVDGQEGITGTIPFKTHMRRIKPGQCFTLSEPGFVLDGQKVRAWGRAIDAQTGVVRIRFRSETDSKHAFALAQMTAAPAGPSLTPQDPTIIATPALNSWSVASETFVANGLSLPALVFAGYVENPTVDAVLFEYRPVADPPRSWAAAGLEGPSVERKEVTGVTPGTAYEAAVSYRRGNVASARLVLGPVVVGELPPKPTIVSATPFTATTGARIQVLVTNPQRPDFTYVLRWKVRDASFVSWVTEYPQPILTSGSTIQLNSSVVPTGATIDVEVAFQSVARGPFAAAVVTTEDASAFTVSASSRSVAGSAPGGGVVTTPAVSLTYSGNTGDVSIEWDNIGGAIGAYALDDNSTSTSFRYTIQPSEDASATFQATVTDEGTGEVRTVLVGAAFLDSTA